VGGDANEQQFWPAEKNYRGQGKPKVCCSSGVSPFLSQRTMSSTSDLFPLRGKGGVIIADRNIRYCPIFAE